MLMVTTGASSWLPSLILLNSTIMAADALLAAFR